MYIYWLNTIAKLRPPTEDKFLSNKKILLTYSPRWGRQTVWHEGIGRCCAWRHWRKNGVVGKTNAPGKPKTSLPGQSNLSIKMRAQYDAFIGEHWQPVIEMSTNKMSNSCNLQCCFDFFFFFFFFFCFILKSSLSFRSLLSLSLFFTMKEKQM